MLIFKGSQVIKYYVMFAFLFVQTVLSEILHLQSLKYQKRAITQKLLNKKISKNFTKYFSHHPLSADTSFKFLSLILFEIWHLQNLISIFPKGRNFTRGDNSKKKKIHVCYFSMRNPYMKFQDDISFRNIIVAKFQGPKF